MELTIAEKILARHADRDHAAPGEYLWCRVDAAAGIPFEALDRLQITELANPGRTFVVEDHLAPAATVERANLMVRRRKAIERFNVGHFFEYGRHGISHQLFAEQGMFAPGELVVMRDSHATSAGVFNACVTSSTADAAIVHAFGVSWLRVPESQKLELRGDWSRATRNFVTGKDVALHLAGTHGTDMSMYKSLEVTGPAVPGMPLADRWTIANMSVELGAKFCLFDHDEVTAEFLADRVDRPFEPVRADAGATYADEFTVRVDELEPLVARPHDPGNVCTLAELERERIKIDQAFIGTCTNGRLEDFELAARILAGRRVDPRVRLLCSPASQAVWKQALDARLWEVFADAGANIGHSTCGPCFGGHMGVLGDGEVSISASNRNFQGRQGSAKAAIYLANPAVVAASAVCGYIADPRSLG